MSRTNYVNTMVFLSFLTVCFFYGTVVQGSEVNFTVPKDYNPTSKLSEAQYKEGELLVRFAPKAGGIQRTIAEKDAVLAGLGGGEVKRIYKLVPGLSLVKLQAGVKVEEVLADFNKADGILYAQPNYIYKACSTFPNDTRFNELWGMHNIGQTSGNADADIDALKAWDIATDANNIIVAVIDTGVAYNHNDLADNMWTDANGCYGYDFVNEDNDPNDDNGHGTHVAGTIGAVGNNGEGITGVCWNAKIMALKCLDSEGYGDTADAIACIAYAVDMGAKVLNNSWGSYEDDPSLLNHIEAANANGVIFVASAGNDGCNNNSSFPYYPASYDCNNIISVMATDHTDEVAYYSNYGPTTVDLAAPGGEINYSEDEGILSTIPGNGYAFYQGTSMAAPHVAGACALVWAANPQLTHLEVKDYILQGVDKLDSLDGLCVTEGRLNLWQAVRYKPPFPFLTLTKDVNDANCVYPFEPSLSNYLTYDICYDANGYVLDNVIITDFLPDEVDYYSSEPNGTYDPNAPRTVTWNIGNPGDSDCLRLTVKVNEAAIPGGTIRNYCEIENDEYRTTATQHANVCCWGSEIIYVDRDANGFNNGTSWDNAYTDLQDALEAAETLCTDITAIWVAEGTYKPVRAMDPGDEYKWESFKLLENVGLFGHFAGTETSTSQRDFADANNETILEGQIGDELEGVYRVVDVEGIEHAIIDGFTITGAVRGGGVTYAAGIYLYDANTAILNCKLKNKYNCGINAHDSSADIHNCTFIDNTSNEDLPSILSKSSQLDISYCIFDGNSKIIKGMELKYGSVNVSDSIFKNHTKYGIYCSGSDLTIDHSVIASNGNNGLYMTSGCNLTLENSVVRYTGSGYDGIYLSSNLNTTIINNWIHDNGKAGIYFYDPDSTPLVRNNTIYNNSTYGIKLNSGADPNVINCIIYDNDSNDLYRVNGSFNKVNYCLLQNDHNGTGNITGDPGFINPSDLNDLHIAEDSNCVDKGDPNGDYGNETDIDGEPRLVDGDEDGNSIVDIGADEYYWSPADFDEDGIVNFIDYAIFADAWQTENANVTLDGDNDVDIDDLALFCKDWLWEPAWGDEGWMMSMGGRGTDGSLMLPDATASLQAQPERLATKTRKFYDLTPDKTITALRKAQEAKYVEVQEAKYVEVDEHLEEDECVEINKDAIRELIDWLDKIWLDGELENWTEDEYLEFRKLIEDALQ